MFAETVSEEECEAFPGTAVAGAGVSEECLLLARFDSDSLLLLAAPILWLFCFARSELSVQLTITAIRERMTKATASGGTLMRPAAALRSLFVSTGINVRLTRDELLLREYNFLVRPFNAEQIGICTTFELKKQARQFAGDHRERSRSCHRSDSHRLN